MRELLVLVCVVASCGARTQLGITDAGESGGPVDTGASADGAACSTPPPAPASPCTAWTLGTPQILAPPPPPNVGLGVGAAVRSGCGVMAAWYTLDESGVGTLAWSTRMVAFDGAALVPAVAHPTLTAATQASGSLSLASNGSTVGALAYDDTGCRFLGLDADGHEMGNVVPLGGSSCGAIAADGAGWNFLRSAADGDTPATLDVLDPGSAHVTPTTLATPGQQVLWDRLVFDDGSFLFDTFYEDSTTSMYTNWLAPFDADGAPLAPQRVFADFNQGAPVLLVAAGKGALAAWQWSALTAEPIDRDGVPTGPPQALSTKSIYAIRLLPVPDGDVLLAWIELEADSSFSMYSQALSPDGVPRGPATLLEPRIDQSPLVGAVEPGGARALLVRARSGGIEALPLTCAR